MAAKRRPEGSAAHHCLAEVELPVKRSVRHNIPKQHSEVQTCREDIEFLRRNVIEGGDIRFEVLRKDIFWDVC